MYVRIARFEGGDGNWDERIAAVAERIAAVAERIAAVAERMRGGGEDNPMTPVRGAVKRALMLVDRDNNRGANVIFCDSEDDMRGVDEAMNQMTPPATAGGRRVSVEMYEIAVDEQPG